ncbi:MAG: MFS transporter [Spirochaetales bacterium]|nr:MFS transporter [Spirochaetales bacterium]
MTEIIKKKKVFYGWIIVAVVALINLVLWGVLSTSFAIYMPEISETMNISTTVVSGAYSFGFAAFLFWCILVGWATDKFGARPVLLVGILLSAVGQVLMTQSTEAWHLYLTYGLFGTAGEAAAMVAGVSLVSRWFEKKRGLAVGIAQGFCGLGAFFAIIAEMTTESYGWQNSVWITTIVMVAICLPLLLLLRSTPEEIGLKPFGFGLKGADDSELKPVSDVNFSFKEAIWTHQFWMIFFIGIVSMMGIGLSVHLKDIFQQAGFDGMITATVLTVAGICATLSAFILGWLSDHIGRKKILTICFCMKMFSIFIILVASRGWHLYTWAVFGGMSAGTAVIFAPLLADWYGTKIHGRLFGVFQGAESIAGAASPVIVGLLINQFTWKAPFFVFLALEVVVLILIFFLRKPKLQNLKRAL